MRLCVCEERHSTLTSVHTAGGPFSFGALDLWGRFGPARAAWGRGSGLLSCGGHDGAAGGLMKGLTCFWKDMVSGEGLRCVGGLSVFVAG